MSIKLMSQIWELDLVHGEKLVMLALADHANDDGFCYPSIGRLAAKTNYSRRAVQRIIRDLENLSLVEVAEEAPGTPGRARLYRVLPPSPQTGDTVTPLPNRGATSETETGDISNATGDTAMTPESSLEPSLESSSNHQRVFAQKNQSKQHLEKRTLLLGAESVEQVLYHGAWIDADRLPT